MANEKKSLLKVFIIVLKKRFNIRHLLFLAILISFNTFAWFIYMNKVDSNISVKVRAWNVSFKFDNDIMTDTVKFNFSSIYPGMEEEVQKLKIVNGGEVDAKITYEIIYARILNEEYNTEDGTITSEELSTKLETEYPFKIVLSTSNEILAKETGEEEFMATVSWNYETMNEDTGEILDEEDTIWGNLAYEYTNNEETKNNPCIELKVKVSAIQIN